LYQVGADAGQYIRFPASTYSSVNRAVERNASEYQKIAKMYADKNWDGVEKAAEKDRKVFDQVSI
jgi:hypothetical protein